MAVPLPAFMSTFISEEESSELYTLNSSILPSKSLLEPRPIEIEALSALGGPTPFVLVPTATPLIQIVISSSASSVQDMAKCVQVDAGITELTVRVASVAKSRVQ